MIKLLGILSVFAVVCGLPKVEISITRLQELVDEVNSKQTTWTAGVNFNSNSEHLDLSHTVGVILERKPRPQNGSAPKYCGKTNLPTHFDARKHWSECASTISHIYDQGNCGSCWAVSSVAVFTDRLCIKSKGKKTHLRSTQQLTSCCHECGLGCNGGKPFQAFQYFKQEGEATGGDYNSTEGCQPYLIEPCAHHVNGTNLDSCTSRGMAQTPKCKLRCYNKNYKIGFKKDRVKGTSAYELNSCAAQHEIYEKGPIVASFAVYEDFLNYKSGVYHHVTGNLSGYHAVRVLGWGVQKNTPYWLVANSWNKSWGDNGLFKIHRGDNECLFEEYFVAGDLHV